MKRIMRMIVIGMLASLSCSYVLVTLSILSKPNVALTGAALLEQIIIAAILGAAIGPMSLIFELERMPIWLQRLLHVAGITTFVLTAGYFGNWFDNFHVKNVLISEAIIYCLVWLLLLILQKKDIAQINDAIKKRKG